MNKNVETIFNSIVSKFKTGEIADSVAWAYFPVPGTPSSSWSFTNRTIMFLSGTGDARGYRQWKAVDRYVKKGSHPLYILAPYFKTETSDDTGKEKKVLNFFNAVPVFRYEDTDGEEIGRTVFEITNLSLNCRGEEWGIPLHKKVGSYRFTNFYARNGDGRTAASPEEIKFFWGLAQSAQKRIENSSNQKQSPFHEAVLDLCAQALCSLVGKMTNGEFKGAFQNIDMFAKDANKSVRYSCLYVLSEAEKNLRLVLQDTRPA